MRAMLLVPVLSAVLGLCSCSPCKELEKRKLSIEVRMAELKEQAEVNMVVVRTGAEGSYGRIAAIRSVNEAREGYDAYKEELQKVNVELLQCK